MIWVAKSLSSRQWARWYVIVGYPNHAASVSLKRSNFWEVYQLMLQAKLRYVVLACALTMGMLQSAHAQGFTVLHTFTGGADGSNPLSSLVLDRNGNLYGVAPFGGSLQCQTQNGIGCGTAFKLAHRGSGWVFSTLYQFAGHGDAANPVGSLAIAADGTVYGTSDAGGNGNCRDTCGDGCGTVFVLQPQPRICSSISCPWIETILYRFLGTFDGNDPLAGVTLAPGGIYGTTYQGGDASAGGVYQLLPSLSGWILNEIHTFEGKSDGAFPASGVIFDVSGNLYGTTQYGGTGGSCMDGGCGTVYELTHMSWNENILYNFAPSAGEPLGGLTFDPAGNLYGTFSNQVNGLFELSPPMGGNWTFTALYSQDYGRASFQSTLARDSAGNLYGTSEFGGNSNCNSGCGLVYKLSPSNGGWVYSQLYAFTGAADGAYPIGGVVLDGNGNLYGTTFTGGTNRCGARGCGVVWEITP